MQKVIILQARMNSSRLPGKIMLPIAGKPAIWHILERLKCVRMIDRICVATTVESSDNDFADYCKSCDVDVVRGSESDVLARYIQAAYAMDADIVVRATADNPLVHPACVDAEIEYIINNADCDYVSMRQLPLGAMVETFTFRTLEKLDFVSKDQIYREHVTYYLHDRRGRHGFHMHDIPAPEFLTRPELRLTMDTREDYELITRIYDNLYSENSIIDLGDVIEFLDINPELLSLNRGVVQLPALTAVLEQALT
jgi:spore coat polysaccharide biosynthesis protein SpsF